MEMFKVVAKCGHVGRSNYVLKTFAVKASDAKEAAAIVRELPRVKHHHKDAIRHVERIAQEEYDQIRLANDDDAYFTCSCIQDQRRFADLFVLSELYVEPTRREESRKAVYDGKVSVRNPKKYSRNTYYIERYAY